MTFELSPLPLPPSADPAAFADFGRQVKGVDPSNLSDAQFKELEEALYKVQFLFNILSQIHGLNKE